ncbi:MAG: hypothetical protein ACOYJ1_11525 [Peptococcales bacterium]
MKAEEARSIWEEEVNLKAQFFIEFIKNKILQYTYQESTCFYTFEFPDFLKTIKAKDEAD